MSTAAWRRSFATEWVPFPLDEAGYLANMERDPIERDIEREEAEAAREAGRIGGRSGMEDVPEEERPLAESGEGESEGAEQMDEKLEERSDLTESDAD